MPDDKKLPRETSESLSAMGYGGMDSDRRELYALGQLSDAELGRRARERAKRFAALERGITEEEMRRENRKAPRRGAEAQSDAIKDK